MIARTILACLLIGSVAAIPPKVQMNASVRAPKEQVIVVQSRIIPGKWGAERAFGSFTVPRNGQAMKFSSGELDFQIYSVDANGREKVHFNRVGRNEGPVPLAQLTLGPGTYFFSIPGQPGASGKLTLTIRTP